VHMTSAMELQRTEWPKEDLEQIGACPVCESTVRQKLYEGLVDRTFFVAAGKWTSWLCGACRSAYLDPRPTRETISRAYERYYTHADPVHEPARNAYQRFRSKVANGYRNARYGAHLRPASRAGKFIGAIPPLGWPIDVEYRYVPRSAGRVLDIGAGGGQWLELAREAGWQVAAAEPDPVACQRIISKGMEARPSADDWIDEAGSFDVVTMSHVIEHVHDPHQLLISAFSLLRPGGLLYVDTPNIDALGHGIYGRHWIHLDPPRHLVLFNRRGLQGAIKAAGFHAIRYRGRPSPLPESAVQSRRIAAGFDPFGSEPSINFPGLGVPQKLRSVVGRTRAEFLTLTATKPE
jgi:2-polyprenyl-3-methyl-5-hydroxy-6-metoxy-1,4-benzoquinol methylase